MAKKRLNVLLLCDYRTDTAATVQDHIDAIVEDSRHRVIRLSMLGEAPELIDFSRFDVVIVHYTLVASMDAYISPKTRQRIIEFRGLKALFIQDEYRWVNDTIAAIRQLGIHLLFTCVPEPEIEKVYSEAALPGVRKVNVLTGYVPDRLLRKTVPPPSARPIDVGYRSRTVPAWLGTLGQEKWVIGERFAEDAPKHDLRCDISAREEDRIYGEGWIDFLKRCKAVLGVESGASVFDFTGEIQRNVEAAQRADPSLTFEELRDRYFPGEDGKIDLSQISPRCFESAALRTVMILYEGAYSGRLVPWRHYVALKKDHSNMDEVAAILHKPDELAAMAERAYQEVALEPQNSYRHFVAIVDRNMEECFTADMASRGMAYSSAEVWARQNLSPRYLVVHGSRLAIRRVMTFVYILLFRYALFWADDQTKERVRQKVRGFLHAVRRRNPWRQGRRPMLKLVHQSARILVFNVLLFWAGPQKREQVRQTIRSFYFSITGEKDPTPGSQS